MKKKTVSTLTALFLGTLLTVSCLTPAPPGLVLRNGEHEILIPGEMDFPVENGEGYFYPLTSYNDDNTDSNKNLLLKIILPEGYSENVDFYFKDGTRKQFDPELSGTGSSTPRSFTFMTFTKDKLLGIGLPEAEKNSEKPLPSLEIVSGMIETCPEDLSLIEGVRISNKTPGTWIVEMNSRDWNEEIPGNRWYIKANYTGEKPGPAAEKQSSTLKVLFGDGTGEEFDFFPKAGENSLYFYSERYEQIPDRIIIISEPDFALSSVSINFRENTENETEAIIADTGTILHYPQEKWRNSRYEYFRWSLYPDVVQILTDSYKTQSRFFKRLAFYVEKPGFVGRLAPNEEIEPLHGWNAHDYGPEDLAAFFDQAVQEKFPLNPEEELLKSLLLQCGVISDANGTIVPGIGALVGTSIETFYEQRLIFMAHESFHGIYFTSPEYRKECESFWNELSPDNQKFWINFLSYRNYNVEEDRDLLINETTTYLLQQPAWQADDYFVGFITPRLLKSRVYLSDWLVPYLLDNPGLFAEEVKAMEEKLYNLAGFTAATVHDLLPKERSKWFIFEGMEEKWKEKQKS